MLLGDLPAEDLPLVFGYQIHIGTQGVERRLRELVLLVGEVDLRIEGLQLRLELAGRRALRRDLDPRRLELSDELAVLLVEGLVPGRERGLARELRVQPHERALDRLPVARVVRDDHADEDHCQGQAGPPERAVQPRDVVVVIDRFGGWFAGHRLLLG